MAGVGTEVLLSMAMEQQGTDLLIQPPQSLLH